jgi:carboxymethylenebutenolidase
MTSEITRRGFVVAGAAAAGYALAVQPVHAEAIKTPEQGLVAGMIEIPSGDLTMKAYRARPADQKNPPTVLVVHEIFGVHEYIQDVCRRFAREGYLAIAPDLYQRQGDVSQIPEIERVVREVVAKVPDPQVLADLDATVAWVKASGEGDPAKLGITGFCWGGRVVWLYSAHSPALKAGVAWYGRLAGRPEVPTIRNPIDVAGELRAPVLGLYGGKDQGIPLDTVEAMREALKKGGERSQIVVYDEAPHGFHADYRESFRADAAQDGWKRLLEWFRKNGAA